MAIASVDYHNKNLSPLEYKKGDKIFILEKNLNGFWFAEHTVTMMQGNVDSHDFLTLGSNRKPTWVVPVNGKMQPSAEEVLSSIEEKSR